MPPSNNDLSTQISASLLSRYNLPVSPVWLGNFVSTIRTPHPPFPALTSTAQFRLLASDFTESLSKTNPTSLLPIDVNVTTMKESRLTGNVPCQVLDVEDIGSSKWSQIEAIERIERGEEIRGREVVRTLPAEDTDGPGGSSVQGAVGAKSYGPHRIWLQDARGTKVVAFEKQKVQRLGIGDDGMNIGMKVVLKEGTIIRRGVVMLIPRTVVVLGGKIEAWDKGWKEGRKERLLRTITQARNQVGNG